MLLFLREISLMLLLQQECFHRAGVGASKSTAPKTSTMEMNTKLYEDVEHNILGMENAGKDDDQVFWSFFGAPILIVVLLSLNDVKITQNSAKTSFESTNFNSNNLDYFLKHS